MIKTGPPAAPSPNMLITLAIIAVLVPGVFFASLAVAASQPIPPMQPSDMLHPEGFQIVETQSVKAGTQEQYAAAVA